jgi:hypothetical protein
MRSNSARLRAIPPPRPPSVKAGRTMHGRPISPRAASASRTEVAIALRGIFSPTASIVRRKRSRSSARAIVS